MRNRRTRRRFWPSVMRRWMIQSGLRGSVFIRGQFWWSGNWKTDSPGNPRRLRACIHLHHAALAFDGDDSLFKAAEKRLRLGKSFEPQLAFLIIPSANVDVPDAHEALEE